VEWEFFSDAIISLLALSEPPVSSFGLFSKKSRLQLYDFICGSSECNLLVVQCPSCDKTTPLRAAMWQKPKAQTLVYHIPGLSYQQSVPEGMGVVVENEKVIGRVRFGVSKCSCNLSRSVLLS
jgi:hypothetical protein